MKTISTTFTRAANGTTFSIGPEIAAFWLIVFALAILDDSERREQDRHRKTESAAPQHRPKPPSGPRPF